MIITGAPIEDLDYEDVDYWDELCTIMDYSQGERLLHHPPVLGCAGRVVLPFRHSQARTARKNVRRVSSIA